MKLFLDTNFIMEFVEQRKQFDKVSIILDSVFSKENEAYISTGCMYTLAFLFEQNLKRQDIHRPELTIQLRSYLAEVLNMAKMVELSHAGAERAVYSEAFTDIEDSFQYQCAVENRCDVLITIYEKENGRAATDEEKAAVRESVRQIEAEPYEPSNYDPREDPELAAMMREDDIKNAASAMRVVVVSYVDLLSHPLFSRMKRDIPTIRQSHGEVLQHWGKDYFKEAVAYFTFAIIYQNLGANIPNNYYLEEKRKYFFQIRHKKSRFTSDHLALHQPRPHHVQNPAIRKVRCKASPSKQPFYCSPM